MKTKYTKLIYVSFVFFLLCLYGCEDYVNVDFPNSQVVGDMVFESDPLATAAVDGIYHQMFNPENFASGGQGSVTAVAGLSADELKASPFSPTLGEFNQNNIDPSNSRNNAVWSSAYNNIYAVNAALEQLENSNHVSQDLRQQLRGEVYFLRAFIYFYLVNLYGELPLVTSTNFDDNALAYRVSTDEVYQLIISDLQQARTLLAEAYRTGERTQANYYTATALLARVSLFNGQWQDASNFSSEVIEATGLYTLNENLNDVFLANSTEAIWQLKPIGGNTNEGDLFILNSSPASGYLDPVYLRESFVNTFASDDLRLLQWINTFEIDNQLFYYPYKYKIGLSTNAPSEYSMVLRLAEMYLIRAEARYALNDNQGALEDLNTIRERAGLQSLTISGTLLMDAIQKEKKKEFMVEWGHRWLDLKRWNLQGQVLSPLKPDWQMTDNLYPIPAQELERDPNLDQNLGY
tara:strand:- start:2919 stop:4307 length:1389 start_codon:yes stop_codon:yes gene_type:complete